MKITDFMVDSPCKVICASYLVLIILGVMSVAFGYFSITLEGGRGRDFSIWKDPLQIDSDLLALANEYITDTKGDALVDLQTESTNFNFLLYTNVGDKEFGLLNKDVLKTIAKLEDDFVTNEDYKKFCLAKKPLQPDDTPICDETMVSSSVSAILGKGMPGALDLEYATQEEINAKFITFMESPLWEITFIRSAFDKYVSPDNLTINYMRSTFQNGGPIENSTYRYKNVSDEKAAQAKELEEYLLAAKLDFDAQDTSSVGLKAEFVTFTILFPQILQLFTFDFGLVIFSIAIVFWWFKLHLKSSVLSIVGVSIIFLSFPFTAFIVSGIFRVGYFGYL